MHWFGNQQIYFDRKMNYQGKDKDGSNIFLYWFALTLMTKLDILKPNIYTAYQTNSNIDRKKSQTNMGLTQCP